MEPDRKVPHSKESVISEEVSSLSFGDQMLRILRRKG
jgi:hypothetical protein